MQPPTLPSDCSGACGTVVTLDDVTSCGAECAKVDAWIRNTLEETAMKPHMVLAAKTLGLPYPTHAPLIRLYTPSTELAAESKVFAYGQRMYWTSAVMLTFPAVIVVITVAGALAFEAWATGRHWQSITTRSWSYPEAEIGASSPPLRVLMQRDIIAIDEAADLTGTGLFLPPAALDPCPPPQDLVPGTAPASGRAPRVRGEGRFRPELSGLSVALGAAVGVLADEAIRRDVVPREGEGDAEEPEQEDEEYEAEVGFLGMLHGDDDPENRKEGGEPRRQAELRASREKAQDDAEREAIDRQLDRVKEQLKALLQKKKEGAAVPKAGQKSARHQADLDAGHKPKLAKRKELSRQRAAQHRQDSREGRSKERKVLDEEWRKRYDRPLGKKHRTL
eukprot:s6753_g2.t1